MSDEEANQANDYVSFFQNQTVFLTGGTGALGGCLLYKMVMELPVEKIFVLVRSIPKAEDTWKTTLPDQIKPMLATGKIVLMVGDITRSHLGLNTKDLLRIEREATIVILSAANITFASDIKTALHDNCLPSLELARMAKSFQKLQCYIQLSTAYVNAFLPDGPMKEETMSIFDAEADLMKIMVDGSSPHGAKFPWPYGHAKHITEHLLQKHYAGLPLLIVRPAAIGSAVRQPYPCYGPTKSIPIENLFKMCTIAPGSGIFHAASGSESGTNIFDETPVDWVANLILLHAAAGTRGVVNTTSSNFVPRTFDGHFSCYRAGPEDAKICFVKNKSILQCRWADLWAVCSRDWMFETKKSEKFKNLDGPLSISMRDVDVNTYDRERKVKVQADIVSSKQSKVKRDARL